MPVIPAAGHESAAPRATGPSNGDDSGDGATGATDSGPEPMRRPLADIVQTKYS